MAPGLRDESKAIITQSCLQGTVQSDEKKSPSGMNKSGCKTYEELRTRPRRPFL
jgi:hypothetical protein